MYDQICCKLPMPDGMEVVKDSFQTKSLGSNLDWFTITETGRLIYHPNHSPRKRQNAPHESGIADDIDLDFHGDLEMNGVTKNGDFVRYVIRFTHGAVEWIRPFETLSPIQK